MASFLKVLIEKNNIRTIFLENPISNTSLINLWLMGKKGSLESAVAPCLYGVWHTKSFFSFLSWLKRWNKLAPSSQVQLIGIDLRQVSVDVEAIRSHLSCSHKRDFEKLYSVKKSGDWREIERRALGKDRRVLRALKSDFGKLMSLVKKLNASQLAPIRSEFRRVQFWIQYLIVSYDDFGRAEQIRDLSMTESLLASLPKKGHSVVIAHAGHLMTKSRNQQAKGSGFRQGQLMGARLRATLASNYKPVLFSAPAVCLVGNDKNPSAEAVTSNRSLETALVRVAKSKKLIIANRNDLLKLRSKSVNPTEISSFIVPENAPIGIQTSSIQGLKLGEDLPFSYIVVTMK